MRLQEVVIHSGGDDDDEDEERERASPSIISASAGPSWAGVDLEGKITASTAVGGLQ